MLTLCDLIVDRLSLSSGYKIVVETIEKCWDWIRSKNVDADQLYYYLENLDENDIMTYMQLEANEDNEAVWICIANTLAYITRDAYLYSDDTYMPETIECVDDETVENFLLNFHEIYRDSDVSDRLLDYMVMNYSVSNEQQIDLLQIKQFVKNNMVATNYNLNRG